MAKRIEMQSQFFMPLLLLSTSMDSIAAVIAKVVAQNVQLQPPEILLSLAE